MRLAILDDYENSALPSCDWKKISPEIEIKVFNDHLLDLKMLADRLFPYDILIIMRERTPFPSSLINQLPNLKLLVTTGKNNHGIDLDACKKNGITVCGTDSSKNAPVELTLALIFALVRKIPQIDQGVRKGKWGAPLGSGLKGKRLGIVGLGQKGTIIAHIGHELGLNVVAWSQNLTRERAEAGGAVYVEKDELFSTSDIISIHLRLSDRTCGIIGPHEFSLMKPSAYFINTSRGPIIQEKALINALREKRIAGAGLDVFDEEPLPPNHPFLSLPMPVLISHI